jgi:hypothetical protein
VSVQPVDVEVLPRRTEFGWTALPANWRRTPDYLAFRRAVLVRDRYTCQGCFLGRDDAEDLGGRVELGHHYGAEQLPWRALDPSNADAVCFFPNGGHPYGIGGGYGCHRPGGSAMHFELRPPPAAEVPEASPWTARAVLWRLAWFGTFSVVLWSVMAAALDRITAAPVRALDALAVRSAGLDAAKVAIASGLVLWLATTAAWFVLVRLIWLRLGERREVRPQRRSNRRP